jgi:hypothetical protein
VTNIIGKLAFYFSGFKEEGIFLKTREQEIMLKQFSDIILYDFKCLILEETASRCEEQLQIY